MKKNYLEIKDVDFKIGGKTKVKSASFSIENEGETLCILGPSGIGKTTILRTIAGLEKIDKGSIHLNDKLLSSKEKNKVYFIHLNHTNPALNEDSKAFKQILLNGFHVARINEVFSL